MSTVQDDTVQDATVQKAPEPEAVAGMELLEPWSHLEEVGVVGEILRPAEIPVVVGSGTVIRSGRLAQSRWLVVVTDRRILCIKGRQPTSRKVIEMPISAIRSVAVRGLWRRMLVLETGYGALRIGSMRKDVAAGMVAGLTALMEAMELA